MTQHAFLQKKIQMKTNLTTILSQIHTAGTSIYKKSCGPELMKVCIEIGKCIKENLGKLLSFFYFEKSTLIIFPVRRGDVVCGRV